MSEFPFKSKTFWVGVICIALGIFLSVSGNRETGIELIMLGLGLLGIRHSVDKVNSKLNGYRKY